MELKILPWVSWLGFKILSRDTGSHQKVNIKISHILGCCGKNTLQMGEKKQVFVVQTTKHQSSSAVQIGKHLREPDARIHNALMPWCLDLASFQQTDSLAATAIKIIKISWPTLAPTACAASAISLTCDLTFNQNESDPMRLKKTQRTWKNQSTIDSIDSYTLRCSWKRSISFSFHWQVRCEAMCRVTGLMQPNVLEMWTKATSFVLGVKSRLNSSTSSFPCTFELRGRAKVPFFVFTHRDILSHWVINIVI